MKKVLVWGFYSQGNLGDDLMAAIFSEMLEEVGYRPVILSDNPRFRRMGYSIVGSIAEAQADHILLGGGAFFKKGGAVDSDIEMSIARLGRHIAETGTPVFGMSLGSDGISHSSQASVARRSVFESPHFRGAAVRLRQDLRLGIPGLKWSPDIVQLTAYCSDRFARLKPINPPANAPETLINLSRRSIGSLPRALWAARGTRTAFFRAHTGKNRTGGEITLPGFRTIEEDDMRAALGYLKHTKKIVSSKLHPGVIALSFGADFQPVSPRPKTSAFFDPINQSSNTASADFASALEILKAALL